MLNIVLPIVKRLRRVMPLIVPLIAKRLMRVKESIERLKKQKQRQPEITMTETIPVYIKGTDKVLQAEPAPDNQAIQADQEATAPKVLPKGDAKASAKTAKVTLVL